MWGEVVLDRGRLLGVHDVVVPLQLPFVRCLGYVRLRESMDGSIDRWAWTDRPTFLPISTYTYISTHGQTLVRHRHQHTRLLSTHTYINTRTDLHGAVHARLEHGEGQEVILPPIVVQGDLLSFV